MSSLKDRALASSPARHSVEIAALLLGFLTLAGFGAPSAHAAGIAYYINNLPNSNCSDDGPHNVAQPWCSFSPLNMIRTFEAGDRILLARGADWNQELSVTGRGTSSEPITLGAYGTGPNPKILRNQATGDICVLLTDASYWNISDLEVGRAGVGILLHYTDLFNNGINISNIYTHDNKGIWAGYSREYPVSHHVFDPFASGLNINVSSGILFNLAAYLSFSSSQYVLKGVSINNVRGENNVDSVSFDAETSTIENQDGHNAFQDVVLNGLLLSNDNGHAERAYQRAGLGCSDGLRLLGMTNVTMMNSVLFNEAGCHTHTGTAAVILGRISQAKFINNIIVGVPSSGSPDETAIDFEWSEDKIQLHSNLFASNAGAGVEILNIHPGDHTSSIDFTDNTFAQNSVARRPGAASIWEDNYGSGYAVPSGSVKNNLYFESHGRFFAGKNVRSISDQNNVQTELVANYAAGQFSAIQGRFQWHYLYEPSDFTWTELPKYSATDNKGAWEVTPAQYVSAFNMAPASCTGACTAGGVARAWVAPHRGIVSIRGRVLKSDNGGGNGIYAAVNLVSGRTTTQIWPAPTGRQFVAASDEFGYATDIDNILVNAGDVIRFEVHANGDNAYDTVSWTPSIAYVPGARNTAESGGPGTGKLNRGY